MRWLVRVAFMLVVCCTIPPQVFGQSKPGDQRRFDRCRSLEEAGQLESAASCYMDLYRLLAFYGVERDTSHLDDTLHRAARIYERRGEFVKAIQVGVLLLRKVPGSSFAAEELYRIAENYARLAVYRKSAEFYEEFVQLYRDDGADGKSGIDNPVDRAERALRRAARFRLRLGHDDKAIEDLLRYLELFGDEEEFQKSAADRAFQIAEVYERKKQPQKAVKQYESYLDGWAEEGSEDHRFEAHVRIGLYHWRRGDRRRALEKFEATLDMYERLPRETKGNLGQGRGAAAHAKFMVAEDAYDDVVEITFDAAELGARNELSDEELREFFKEKLEAAEEAQKLYEEVIRFRRARWAVAALYKIGSLYEEFAATFRDQPIPERLSPAEKRRYEEALETKARVVLEKGISAYERALGVGRKERCVTRYTRLAKDKLSELRPNSYQKTSEMYARPRQVKKGYTRADFIRESVDESEFASTKKNP